VTDGGQDVAPSSRETLRAHLAQQGQHLGVDRLLIGGEDDADSADRVDG
jgi:hypothetical protein